MRDNCGSAVLQDHPAASVLPQPLLVEFYCQAQEQRTKKRPQAGFVSLSYPRSRAASPDLLPPPCHPSFCFLIPVIILESGE